MLRFRLASLALACGLLFTASGCFTTRCCDEGGGFGFGGGGGGGRWFSRLFSNQSQPTMIHSQPAECECQTPAGMPGPIITTTPHFPPAPVPITNAPPHILKVPQAPSTPYFPPVQ